MAILILRPYEGKGGRGYEAAVKSERKYEKGQEKVSYQNRARKSGRNIILEERLSFGDVRGMKFTKRGSLIINPYDQFDQIPYTSLLADVFLRNLLVLGAKEILELNSTGNVNPDYINFWQNMTGEVPGLSFEKSAQELRQSLDPINHFEKYLNSMQVYRIK